MTAAVHGPRVTQADQDKKRRRLMLKLARAHDRIVSEPERGAETALRCGNGLATGYWEELAKVAERHFAALTKSRTDATGEGA